MTPWKKYTDKPQGHSWWQEIYHGVLLSPQEAILWKTDCFNARQIQKLRHGAFCRPVTVHHGSKKKKASREESPFPLLCPTAPPAAPGLTKAHSIRLDGTKVGGLKKNRANMRWIWNQEQYIDNGHSFDYSASI